jgi:hypothetical protein
LPDRIREVHRQCLEFWYDPPGCALTDEELDLLRRIASAEAPVMFQAEGSTVPAHLAFDHRVDVLRTYERRAGLCSRCGLRNPATEVTLAGAVQQPKPTVRSQGAKPSR